MPYQGSYNPRIEEVMTTQEQWTQLYELVNESPIAGLSVTHANTAIPGIQVLESSDAKLIYSYRRHFDGSRFTDKDLFGLVGLCSCDFTCKSVILTEGVSDFLTMKVLTNLNVLGRTRISMSSTQLGALSALFNKIIIIADSDKTGLNNAMNLVKQFQTRAKLTKIIMPRGYKDITEQFMNEGNLESICSQIKQFYE